MDVAEILKGLKGKVLDAAHFDLLKHAYDLQEENIKQLKTNNEALKESNALLQERVKKLESTQKALEQSFEKLQAEESPAQERIHLSEIGLAVLEAFFEADTSELFEGRIIEECGLTRIQTQAAIAELQDADLMNPGVKKAGGALYSLNGRGKRICSQLGPP